MKPLIWLPHHVTYLCHTSVTQLWGLLLLAEIICFQFPNPLLNTTVEREIFVSEYFRYFLMMAFRLVFISLFTSLTCMHVSTLYYCLSAHTRMLSWSVYMYYKLPVRLQRTGQVVQVFG